MKSTNRIALLLGLAFLLPALFFSVYEMSSLNKDEKMIQQIYEKQLDAILFSVNQYSDDILTRWVSDIESSREELSVRGKLPDKINNLLSYNSSLTQLFICDTIDQKVKVNFFSLDTSQTKLESDIRKALIQSKIQIQQLIEYKNSGFQKIQALAYKWPNQ